MTKQKQTETVQNDDIQTELDKLPTTSSKIRFLHSKNYDRSKIAKTLQIRYQHVRNVLITPIKNEKK